MEITFLGATSTVTGSRYLVSAGRERLLIDCGLFQGLKQLRLRNREPFPVDPRSISAVVLTHAHLDHSGYLPVLVRDGFRGPVYCTPATADLLRILLLDSGHIQEEEAGYANRHGFSRHHPALPLYTVRDAEAALELLVPVPMEATTLLGQGTSFTFHRAGHILGAAMVSLRHDRTSVLFSGDLGRPHDPLLGAPVKPWSADYLVMESTYGGKLHPQVDPLEELGRVIKQTAARGGAVVIPAFAVGRVQQVLYLLHRLIAEDRMRWLPIFLDSPMASRANQVFASHLDELQLTAEEARAVSSVARIVETVQESREIDRMPYPRVIIAGSGMATGGRVLHHLKALGGDPRNTILFTGFQGAGTRGAAILGGTRQIKIHGRYVEMRARVETLENLSAHADEGELLDWLSDLTVPPRLTFLTHGEPLAVDALRRRIEETRGWAVRIPEYRETVRLAPGGAGRDPLPAGEPLVALAASGRAA